MARMTSCAAHAVPKVALAVPLSICSARLRSSLAQANCCLLCENDCWRGKPNRAHTILHQRVYSRLTRCGVRRIKPSGSFYGLARQILPPPPPRWTRTGRFAVAAAQSTFTQMVAAMAADGSSMSRMVGASTAPRQTSLLQRATQQTGNTRQQTRTTVLFG